ncbi:hypothetical protein M8818_005973 [Zalaria obscura]|uniref:Uncharacterized protein n=1 Tax=Zalaria obscura TaxID=2024903 RepID=A0ACC3S6J9_9PEZI
MAEADTTNGTQAPKKELILNAFVINAPGHLSAGSWKHPRSRTTEYKKLKFWTDLAQLLDKANFHAMFIADVLGPYDVYKGPANHGPAASSGAQYPMNDPLYTVPAMAAVTDNLIFGVTASTTYDAPYALARRFSSVDHLSDGRVAWNIVTSYLDSAARNFGLNTQVEHDERYRIAGEYMDVVYKLWEGSWCDDAVVADTKTGVYAEPDRIRQINHEGKYFNVPGPHFCEPSPQRTPFLFQAGTSKSGSDFGAKHAEAIFMGGQTPEKVRPLVDNIRQSAKEKFGRDPSHIKILVGMTIIVAETDGKAKEKEAELRSYADKDGTLALFGGWTGIDLSTYSDDEDFRFVKLPAIQSIINTWTSTVPGSEGLPWTKARIADYLALGGMTAKVVGSPKTVVDELERWVEISGVDGFNLTHVVNPGSFEDIIDFVLPELQRRGLFRTKVRKEGATAREVFLGSPHLLPDHPGSQFKWKD